MKQMTLNAMLYKYVNEKEELKYESVNDFHDDDDPLKVIIEEQLVVNEQSVEDQDHYYIRCKMIDEIPEREYTIKYEGYVDKNGKPLDDETSIKHLTNGESLIEICNELEHYDENGDIYYVDYDEFYCMDHNKYDFSKITKQIRTKKFICEAPIGSGKSTAIHKWISSHRLERFMVIVPTVNIDEEFYGKLNKS